MECDPVSILNHLLSFRRRLMSHDKVQSIIKILLLSSFHKLFKQGGNIFPCHTETHLGNACLNLILEPIIGILVDVKFTCFLL